MTGQQGHLLVPKSDIPLSELPIAFRRVAAVAGDEIVSSQPSDEPIRIEKDHFWLLADNLAVPAKEAIDSRTIGPVHKNYIFERALYMRGQQPSVVLSCASSAGRQGSMAPMTSILTRLKYYRERAQVLAFVCQHAFYSKNPRGELPLYNWMKFIALGMKERFPLITQLESSEVGSEAMKPAIKGIKDEWVLHRVLLPRSVKVHVGDVLCPTVVFRRVAAVAGDEIVSSQPSDMPIRIEENHFWVLADNPDVPAKEAWDSRTFGPVHLEDVLGRAMYVVRSMHDHGPIQNRSQLLPLLVGSAAAPGAARVAGVVEVAVEGAVVEAAGVVEVVGVAVGVEAVGGAAVGPGAVEEAAAVEGEEAAVVVAEVGAGVRPARRGAPVVARGSSSSNCAVLIASRRLLSPTRRLRPDVALAISRRGPPLSSHRLAISSLPSRSLSSPVAFPLPSPFLSRRLSSPVAFPLPSAFLSCRLSSPVAFPLPPPFLLSRRPSYFPIAFLSHHPSSPAALPSSRRLSLPSLFLSPVALPSLPSPFSPVTLSSLPSPFLSCRLSLSRRLSSPVAFLSPIALSLLSPFLSHRPFSPVALHLSRREGETPARRPSFLPSITHLGAFALAPKCLLVALPLSPPITHLGACALAPKCMPVALSFSPPITHVGAFALAPKCLLVDLPFSPPITHVGAFALAPKCLLVALPLSPPITHLGAFALAPQCLPIAPPLAPPITHLGACTLAPKCMPVAPRFAPPITHIGASRSPRNACPSPLVSPLPTPYHSAIFAHSSLT
ncbi:unnamed protein product [Closterium sp. Yama58-4]|nr:unnamed protein product [Closterium sp. Yama58-4]